MCEIGSPIEIIQVEPLALPAPLPRREIEPEPEIVPIYIPALIPIEAEDGPAHIER